jgi:hypothetical protein
MVWKGDLRVSSKRCQEPWSGGRSLETPVRLPSGRVLGEGGGRSPGSLEGRHEADLGPWKGGRKGCWTRRARRRRGREALRGILETLATWTWSSGSCPEATGCLPSGECSGGRTAEAARSPQKAVRPGPSGRGGTTERRPDEAAARARGRCPSGCRRRARGKAETDGPSRGGLRFAAARPVATRPTSGVVRRPMESSGGCRQEDRGSAERVNVKRAKVTERWHGCLRGKSSEGRTP